MKRIFLICLIILSCSSCSLVPRVTFDKAGVTPTSTDKSQKKETCKGEYTTDETGRIISCSKGYYNYEKNFKEEERKYTIQERLGNFIRGLAGFGFWGLLIIAILFPSVIGFIVGRLIEAVQGVGSKALKQIVKGVQKAKTDNVPLVTALEASTDESTKAFIAKFKLDNNIK